MSTTHGSRRSAERSAPIAILAGLALLLAAPHAGAQDLMGYRYVHKRLFPMQVSPWACYCYSASQSAIIFGQEVVSRHGSWDEAFAARDRYSAYRDTCSSCPSTGGSAASDPRGGSQRGGYWVYATCYSNPCTIGVANEHYALPGSSEARGGWARASQRFANDRQAWDHACKMHRQQRYHSPDIQAGRARCNVGPGPGNDAAALAARTCASVANLKSGREWAFGANVGVSRYYEHGGFLCAANKGSALQINQRQLVGYTCSNNWRSCKKNTRYNADLIYPAVDTKWGSRWFSRLKVKWSGMNPRDLYIQK